MPQILAVFVTVFWLVLAAIGVLDWYWALLGWFVCGPVYIGIKRLVSSGDKDDHAG